MPRAPSRPENTTRAPGVSRSRFFSLDSVMWAPSTFWKIVFSICVPFWVTVWAWSEKMTPPAARKTTSNDSVGRLPTAASILPGSVMSKLATAASFNATPSRVPHPHSRMSRFVSAVLAFCPRLRV